MISNAQTSLQIDFNVFHKIGYIRSWFCHDLRNLNEYDLIEISLLDGEMSMPLKESRVNEQ